MLPSPEATLETKQKVQLDGQSIIPWHTTKIDCRKTTTRRATLTMLGARWDKRCGVELHRFSFGLKSSTSNPKHSLFSGVFKGSNLLSRVGSGQG